MPRISLKSERHRQSRANGLAVLATGAALMAPAADTAAGELCVRCEAPFAIYACSIDGMDADAGTASGAHLHCIRELAKTGGHARCAVDARSAETCTGAPVRLAAPPPQPIVTLPPRLAPAPPDTSAPDTGQAPATEPAADGSAPAPGGAPQGAPRTVEELAKRTAQSSKEGLGKATDAVVGAAKSTGQTLEKAGDAVGSAAKGAGEAVGSAAQKAGDAVGSAAKKTWRCLTSLFGDC